MSRERHDSFSSEEEMYAFWTRHATPTSFFTGRDGIRIRIVSPGRRNHRSGPDFLDAVLLIDGRLQVGAVEMHREESEWYLHGHHVDPVYRSVILHVVEHFSGSPGRRTTLPTLRIDQDEEPAADPPLPPADDASGGADLPLLLADLSWRRFLRRAERMIDGSETPLRTEELVVPLFRALGYRSNADAMQRTALRLLRQGLGDTPEETLRRTIDAACFPTPVASALFERFGRAAEASVIRSRPEESWDFTVRPGNRPEVRIIAGAVLVDRSLRHDLIRRLRERIGDRRDATELLEPLLVEGLGQTFLGPGRGATVVVDVLLPAFAAEALRTGDHDLLASACDRYRHHPRLPSNGTIREFLRRFCREGEIPGAFHQQGALEYFATIGPG